MESVFQVKVGDVITSPSALYMVHQILGSGIYGDVTLCRNVYTNQTVAVKVLKDPKRIEQRHEKKILKKMKRLGSDNFNIVRWFSSFYFRGHFCHEFERLDISLKDFLVKSPCHSLQLKEIRPILHQMAGAQTFLRRIGIIHGDLKPDNIMLIDHLAQPLRIKVIDFGKAGFVSQATQGATIQPLCYRSPEVLVGVPFNEAVDMWSLGCIVAQMFLGQMLFRSRTKNNLMRQIIEMVGQPPKHMLDTGVYTHEHFYLPEGSTDWAFKSSDLEAPFAPPVKQLDAIFECNPRGIQNNIGLNLGDAFDRISFIDLVKNMLDLNPATRITPKEIFEHPFITLSHLDGCFDNFIEYLNIMKQVLGLKEEQPTPFTSVPETRPAPQTSVATQGPPSPNLKRKRDADNKQGRQSSKVVKKGQLNNTVNSSSTKRRTTGQQFKAEECTNMITLESPVSRKRQRDNNNNFSTKKRRTNNAQECPEVTSVESPLSLKRQRQEEDSVIIIDSTSPPKQRRLSVGHKLH